MIQLNGVLVIDKPQNMTSHDVVAILRKQLKTKKVGHTGTLDPMATGVLPICIGKGTKIVDFLTDQKKRYACTMALGAMTDTQDVWGTVLKMAPTAHIDASTYKEAIMSFVGDILQVPPMYSALKVGGEKLVDLARKGIVVERPPRPRTIYAIENITIFGERAQFDVTCSKGTYIRTLCNDIGEKLGTHAHMTALKRLASDPFELEDVIDVETVKGMTYEALTAKIVPVDKALSFMGTVEVPSDPVFVKKIANGVKVNLQPFLKRDGLSTERFYRVYVDGTFYGIAEKTSSGIYIKKLMVG
ncbi:tRNA pseudouridine(55) synthase TruB [Fusibacter sp. JL298sf-3]